MVDHTGAMRIRPVVLTDCDALGLITVTASLAAFLGQVPEEDLDLSWTPTVSARNWRASLSVPTKQGEFMSVAEVDDQDLWQSIALGVAAVGSDSRHVASELEEILRQLRMHPEAELIDHDLEIQ